MMLVCLFVRLVADGGGGEEEEEEEDNDIVSVVCACACAGVVVVAAAVVAGWRVICTQVPRNQNYTCMFLLLRQK